MFTLAKQFRFEASHQLKHHDGHCARLHGHSWLLVVETSFADKDLHRAGPENGMALDYGKISAAVNPIIDDCLDHRNLNDTIDPIAPTSEAVARFVFDKLQGKLPGLTAVTVAETASASCTYRP